MGNGIRRALVLASAGRYAVLVIQLTVTIVVARFLTPGEYGLAVLGMATLGLLEVLRDAGVATYLIQQKDLALEKVRTAFTITLLLTLGSVGLLLMVAEPIAEFYGHAGLEQYLQIAAIAFLLGPFSGPISSLLRRDMEFGIIFFVTVSGALVYAIVAITLVIIGFSYMSFAWASLAAGVTMLVLLLLYRPDLSIFRLSLGEWRSVIGFGIFESGNRVLEKIWQTFPYLLFGRVLGTEAVGLYQRAWMLNRLPDRTMMAGIFSLSLPVLAKRARDGGNLKESYLRAIELITAVHWPAQLGLALLAYPIVLILLGPRWSEVAPLLQIMACAQLSAFTVSLNYPMLISVGAIRQTLPLTILQVGSSVAVVSFAASYGLYAVVFSLWFTVPFNVFLSVWLVRRHVPFRWRELGAATRKSAIVAALSSFGPLIVVIIAGSFASVTVSGFVIAVVLSGIGWLSGLWLTKHPLLPELVHLSEAFPNNWVAATIRERGRRILRHLPERKAG